MPYGGFFSKRTDQLGAGAGKLCLPTGVRGYSVRTPFHRMRAATRPFFLLPVLVLGGCIHVRMDPIKVHAVVDVNVKMEQAVTDLLADIYGDSATVNPDKLAVPAVSTPSS